MKDKNAKNFKKANECYRVCIDRIIKNDNYADKFSDTFIEVDIGVWSTGIVLEVDVTHFFEESNRTRNAQGSIKLTPDECRSIAAELIKAADDWENSDSYTATEERIDHSDSAPGCWGEDAPFYAGGA